jgi:hypothetical protein
MALFNNNNINTSMVAAATVSGTTPTWGTAVSLNDNVVQSSAFFNVVTDNSLFLAYNEKLRPITLSGAGNTTVSVGSTISLGANVTTPNYMLYNRTNARLYYVQQAIAASTNAASGFYTNVTTTLTTTNCIGVSSASYTNGQTATVNVIGSTKGGYTGLSTGVPYYVTTVGGVTQDASTQSYIGIPISSTTLLVKG